GERCDRSRGRSALRRRRRRRRSSSACRGSGAPPAASSPATAHAQAAGPRAPVAGRRRSSAAASWLERELQKVSDTFFSEKVSDTIFSLLVEQAPAKLGAQLLAADLADGCRPEAVDEHDLIRHLELGETALADPGLQRGRFRLLAARDHERAAALAEV